MPLPAPNLDDRRFQDLVDDAKRLVQRRCPEWTDHNVSDPGVTLIEAFAFMVDQLLYRLNRVPDRNYLKFLDLIGLRPFPPTAATVDVTFWLSAPREQAVPVPAGTQVATVRTEGEEPVTFATTEDIAIVPTRMSRVLTQPNGEEPADRTDDLTGEQWVPCFAERPVPGDAVLFGLNDPAPGCAVMLRLDCVVAGRGVDPRDPPLVWEAWTDSGWRACAVERDTTGALNRAGEVVLHLPPGHAASVIARRRAGWLRCRLVPAEPGQPFFHASPQLRAAEAATVGGSGPAVHAELVTGEVLGLSEGVPGQRFTVRHAPIVVGDEPLAVEVAGGGGWTGWREVATFADSGPEDRHVRVDRGGGEIAFGPAVRQPDGTVRQYGAVPPKAAPIRVAAYRTGGGRRGNVARGSLAVLRDPVPFVSTVTNRAAATGGVDGESVADAATRGPLLLRTRERAVTAEDYEQLAREAAPEAVRVRCVPARADSAAVRVLVVPAVPAADPMADPMATDGSRFADLQPPGEMLERIRGYLDERRCVGARVIVEPPYYQGLTVVARIRARPRTTPETVRERALRALYGYLDPVAGGPDGSGWPFGRPIQSGEIFAVLQQLSGVDLVEDVLLFAADPVTGERGSPVQRVDLSANGLVFSYGHQVRVV
ncbi:putative baseplate assembly protein [Rhizomonospora bruguierae]|uniref:putative baseplate assembly protein n=1 Tax=Rhizomonospora bruguierae TaxID=1581705 RepID=UPI001BCB5C7D|nr:putative baseplate assembly protein [Micromonospora sp. NBRC 107566]